MLTITSVFSCTSNIGRFTAISTDSVRGLEYAGKNRDEILLVSAKSCSHRIYLTRVAVGVLTFGIGWFFPQFDLVLGDGERDRLNNSVSEAIKTGKKSGVFDGDLLINASIKQKNIIIPLIYGYKCYIAEGDLVSSVLRSKDYLQKK